MMPEPPAPVDHAKDAVTEKDCTVRENAAPGEQHSVIACSRNDPYSEWPSSAAVVSLVGMGLH
jgi:hypothetical protein